MRSNFRVLFLSLLVMGSTSLASANEPTTDTVDPTSMTAMDDLSLDSAFERATTPNGDRAMKAPAGPTTMQCENGTMVGSLETCVVTAEGTLAAMPAALAQP
jgi:hypothetical protein